VSNTKKTEKTDNFKQNVTKYFKGVRSEWGKIIWPERRHILFQSIVVIVVVFFFSVLVYAVDMAFCFVLHPNPKGICQCLHPNQPERCK